MAQYIAKRVKFQNGERHSVLLGPSGLPVHEATLFLLGFRTRGLAANTIHIVCTVLTIVHRELDAAGINLMERLQRAQFLTTLELDRLATAAQYRIEDLTEEEEPKRKARVISIHRVHPKSKLAIEPPPQVDLKTRAARLHYIAQYLEFLAGYVKGTLPRAQARELAEDAQQGLKAFRAGIPRAPTRAKLDARTGLSKEERSLLLQVAHPDSAKNPWKRDFTRRRNWVILVLLLATGMRRGELLGLKIKDLHSNEPKLNILRRADDVRDPRPIEPNTKTGERTLTLPKSTMRLLWRYINEDRRAISAARKHDYVMVSDDGSPFSLSSIDKLFKGLRSTDPGLPKSLTCHVLRHTWNDSFSELADALGLSPEIEQKARNEQQGWTDNSQMAVTYTRRSTMQKGRELALEMNKYLDEILERDEQLQQGEFLHQNESARGIFGTPE